ncbi:hypothetical protein N0V95_005498 [Ascochyta clinopodiicola]|nr:hypothetical protein N0V95_005498 [Ascochyta clinopodiicola]
MAADWPHDHRAYPRSQPAEPPAPVRTLPSVAELLSSRPSADSSIPAYHRRDHHLYARSTPPAASLAPATTNLNATSPSNINNANASASPYWKPANHRPTSPPVSPTEQRPQSMSTSTTSTLTPATTSTAISTPTRTVYQEPQFRRQQPPNPDAATTPHSSTSSGMHSMSHSSTVQARQDSATDQHRFELANDAQLAKPTILSAGQSPKNGHRQPSTAPNSYSAADPSTLAYAPPAPPQGETHSNLQGAQHPARQHSKSLSSGLPYSAASPRAPEHRTERTIPVDTRNASDPRLHNNGPSSPPEPFYGHQNSNQNSNGTRQQRYNVRFAANYTSENMPPSQKSRNDPPTPNPTSAMPAEPEQPRSSPALVPTTEEYSTSTANGSIRHSEPTPRATRDARDARDRGDREHSVERCSGCNEAWTRPIPDLDSRHISPAETGQEFGQITSNMIERLRKQNKMADAAYDEWKWRHSRCTYRAPSPFSSGSVEDAPRRTESVPHAEGSTNGTTDRKRKSDVPLEQHSASKQQRVAATSPAPPVRRLESL